MRYATAANAPYFETSSNSNIAGTGGAIFSTQVNAIAERTV
ncbi:MAG: hypothetical protein RID09_26940 [Coleofasciculus sp. G1-WW12-02]